jgi:hypothetical protein
MPRLTSRFAQLAVAGARLCTGTLAAPLPPATPVYLATGLGDIARTDTLYYQVMPPSGEMASPAQFATSGNNMPAFFVAQQLGLTSRNLTLSQQDMSVEYALELALDDLAAGISTISLVGSADETTVPREFYARRYPLSADQFIGEGSAWLVLGTVRAGAVGELLGVSIDSAHDDKDPHQWAERTATTIQGLIGTKSAATLVPGVRLSRDQVAAVRARVPGMEIFDYRAVTGCLPTASALAIAGTFAQNPTRTTTYVHANCDAEGRTGIIAWRRFRLPAARIT